MAQPGIYVAIQTWSPEADGEYQIPVKRGDEIDVKAIDDSGWWYGMNTRTEEEGYFPESYVKKKQAPPRAPPPFNGPGRAGQKLKKNASNKPAWANNNSTNRGNTFRDKADSGTFRAPTALATNRTIRDVPNWTDDHSTRQKNISKNEKKRIEYVKQQIDQQDPALNPEWKPEGNRPGMLKNYTVRNANVLEDTLKHNQNSKTIWCVVAHYQGYLTGVCCLWMAVVSFKWAASDNVGGFIGFKAEWITALYCIGLGPLIIFYEKRYGVHLADIEYKRPAVYAAVGVLPWAAVPTMLAGFFCWMTAATYALSIYCGEAGFKFRKKRNAMSGKPYLERITKWFKDLVQQNKWQKYTFLVLWLVINAFVYLERMIHFDGVIDDLRAADPDNVPFSGWLSHAKAWGTILDLNMAMMLVPVSKSLIRVIYNYSTDQTKLAKCLRWALFIIPLDKAIQYHKLMSMIILLATFMHSFCHMMQYADVPQTYKDTWGAWIWFNGVTLLLISQWIFSCALDVVRKVKFEIFYYIHHLFVLYYGFTLFHGAGFWNPNFWKYLLIPGFIYLLERIAREKNASTPVGVVSVTMMNVYGNVRVLCLELEKKGAISSHKEGQYVDIKCPIVSRYQWHPFTISSAPQLDTVTLHIRDMGEGSWTNRVFNYFRALAGGKSTRVCLVTRKGRETAPQSVGPDGLPLIQVNGPHSAPTQHLGEYEVAMIGGAGIGVTPLRATLQSVAHRFKYSVGVSFPDHAYFFWLVSHKDLKTYKFMVRTLKEVCDQLYDFKKKNPQQMKTKTLRIHVWVTSVPRTGVEPYQMTADEEKAPDEAIWGPSMEQMAEGKYEVLKNKAPFDEWELFKNMWYGDKKTVNIGDFIRISRFYDADENNKKERPQWGSEFNIIKEKHPGKNCGVMYCGPPAIADILKKECGTHTDYGAGNRFILHKENF